MDKKTEKRPTESIQSDGDDSSTLQEAGPGGQFTKQDGLGKEKPDSVFLSKLFAFFKNEKFLIAQILVLSIATRFYHFGEPRQIVLDEVYFPKFVTDYFEGEYFFDIHPPLAKLMMAGWAELLGAEPPVSFDFKNIGKEYPSNFYMYLRFLVCLFGVLLPLSVYLLSRELFGSRWPAFLSALFVVFDNAILTQSRYILIDVFLLVFGILGLWLLLLTRRKPYGSRPWLGWTGLSGSALAASCSVKWTGAIFFGLAGLVLLYDCIRTKKWIHFVVQAGLLLAVGFVLYFSFFAIHLKLLYRSGDGDMFMSASFRNTLEDSRRYDPRTEPAGLFAKFTELNRVMLTANASITATHTYSSKWYTWPLMLRPMYYWVGSGTDDKTSKIYFQGNPIIWWLVFLVFIYWVGWSVWKLYKRESDPDLFLVLFVLAGYLCNMLAYILVSRVTFLYHYLPSLLMMILGLGLFLHRYFGKYRQFVAMIVVVSIVMFIYFAPLSYGLPLSDSAFQDRVWFKSWQ